MNAPSRPDGCAIARSPPPQRAHPLPLGLDPPVHTAIQTGMRSSARRRPCRDAVAFERDVRTAGCCSEEVRRLQLAASASVGGVRGDQLRMMASRRNQRTGWSGRGGSASFWVGGAVAIGAVECSPGFKICGPARCPPTGVAGWSRLQPTPRCMVGDHASTTGGDMAVAAAPVAKYGRVRPRAPRRRLHVLTLELIPDKPRGDAK